MALNVPNDGDDLVAHVAGGAAVGHCDVDEPKVQRRATGDLIHFVGRAEGEGEVCAVSILTPSSAANARHGDAAAEVLACLEVNNVQLLDDRQQRKERLLIRWVPARERRGEELADELPRDGAAVADHCRKKAQCLQPNVVRHARGRPHQVHHRLEQVPPQNLIVRGVGDELQRYLQSRVERRVRDALRRGQEAREHAIDGERVVRIAAELVRLAAHVLHIAKDHISRAGGGLRDRIRGLKVGGVGPVIVVGIVVFGVRVSAAAAAAEGAIVVVGIVVGAVLVGCALAVEPHRAARVGEAAAGAKAILCVRRGALNNNRGSV